MFDWKQPLRVLWKLGFFGFFILSLVGFYPLMRVLLASPKRFNLAFKIIRFWAILLLRVPGVHIRRQRLGKLPNGPFIICPNHSSYIDILALYRLFPRYFVFMGKAEINRWPLFNIFFTMGMNISVDRNSNTSAHLAFERAKAEIDLGHSIAIFPEGTIPTDAPNMRGFKNGAFKLAIEKNVPIVPVTFLDNWKRLQTGAVLRAKGGPGWSRVVIHPPVYPEVYGPAGVVQMKHDVFKIIEAPLTLQYGSKQRADRQTE